MGAHGESGVEEEYSLLGPTFEVAAGEGGLMSQVAFDFFINVLDGGRQAHPGIDGKAESVGLPLFVIGILAEDHDFDLIEGGEIKGTKNKFGGRIDRRSLIFSSHKVGKLCEIIFPEFVSQCLFPTWLDFDFHSYLNSICKLPGSIISHHIRVARFGGAMMIFIYQLGGADMKNVMLWILQILLALYNLAGGFYALSNYKMLIWPSMHTWPQIIWIAIFSLQILAALGLVLPKLTRVAAIYLTLYELLSCVLYPAYAGFPNMLWGILPAAFSALVAYGRSAQN